MTPTEIEEPQGTAGDPEEDVLYRSDSAHYHLTSQAIRFPATAGDALPEAQRELVQEWFDEEYLEPAPVQVTTRNRTGEALRVRSEWDGVQIHLDVCPTGKPTLGARDALRAAWRFYRSAISLRQVVRWLVLAGLLAVVAIGALIGLGVL